MSKNAIGLSKASQEVFARIAYALRAFFLPVFGFFVAYFYLLFLLMACIQIDVSQ